MPMRSSRSRHHVLQKAEGHVVAARHLRVHHLEYRAFGGTGADRVDVRFRHFWPVGQIGGQLFHFLLEQRRVPAYGEDQLVRRPRRHLLAHPRAWFSGAQSAHSASLMGEKSTMAFFFFSSVYSFLRPSALPLTKNTTQAVGGIRSTYSAI